MNRCISVQCTYSLLLLHSQSHSAYKTQNITTAIKKLACPPCQLKQIVCCADAEDSKSLSPRDGWRPDQSFKLPEKWVVAPPQGYLEENLTANFLISTGLPCTVFEIWRRDVQRTMDAPTSANNAYRPIAAVVIMALYRIVIEIKRDIGRKSHFFIPLPHNNPVSDCDYVHAVSFT